MNLGVALGLRLAGALAGAWLAFGFARVDVGVTAGAGGELGRDSAGGVGLAGRHGRGGVGGWGGSGAAAEGVRPSCSALTFGPHVRPLAGAGEMGVSARTDDGGERWGLGAGRDIRRVRRWRGRDGRDATGACDRSNSRGLVGAVQTGVARWERLESRAGNPGSLRRAGRGGRRKSQLFRHARAEPNTVRKRLT